MNFGDRRKSTTFKKQCGLEKDNISAQLQFGGIQSYATDRDLPTERRYGAHFSEITPAGRFRTRNLHSSTFSTGNKYPGSALRPPWCRSSRMARISPRWTFHRILRHNPVHISPIKKHNNHLRSYLQNPGLLCRNYRRYSLYFPGVIMSDQSPQQHLFVPGLIRDLINIAGFYKFVIVCSFLSCFAMYPWATVYKIAWRIYASTQYLDEPWHDGMI